MSSIQDCTCLINVKPIYILFFKGIKINNDTEP